MKKQPSIIVYKFMVKKRYSKKYIRKRARYRIFKKIDVCKMLQSIIEAVIISLLLPMFFTIFESIHMTQANIRNVPSSSLRFNIDNKDEAYSNYIENTVVLSGKKHVLVDKITLKNVTQTPFEYTDLKISYGLDVINQRLSIFVYQNGNESLENERFTINLKKSNIDLLTEVIISKTTDYIDFQGGDIVRILSLDLSKEISSYFDFSDGKYLSVEVFRDKDDDSLLTNPTSFEYNQFSKRFTLPTSASGGASSSNNAVENIFDLSRFDDKGLSNFELITDSLINDENKTVKFNVLFGKTATWEYDIGLSYQNNYIKTKGKNVERKRVNVKLPYYKNYIGSNDKIYSYMESNNLKRLSLSQVEDHASHLLYEIPAYLTNLSQ